MTVNAKSLLLGKKTEFKTTYTPSLLHGISRASARKSAGIDLDQAQLDFGGQDLWHGYEFSWLNKNGLPQIGCLRISVPCASANIVESKSLKLYLGSFSQTKFNSRLDLVETLSADLKLAVGAAVIVELLDLHQLAQPGTLSGHCLDGQEISCSTYERKPSLLAIDVGKNLTLHETLFTHLFRSICPVTGQPDWATIAIEYLGPPINRAGLLKYLVSYRTHAAFHEPTVEQIFLDLIRECRCVQLTVTGYFLRRGGIDINPFRSNFTDDQPALRLIRQ